MKDSGIEDTPRSSKKDLKRSRILEAAKRRFGRFGIRATTMQDIASDAGIAVGTIYQFFPDKDALILGWVEEHRELIRSQLEEVLAKPLPAEEKLREFLRLRFRTVRTVREEPAIAEITRVVLRLTPESIREMSKMALNHLRTILDEGAMTGTMPSVRPAEDAEVLFLALGGFFTASDDPIQGPPDERAMMRVVDWFIAKWKLPCPTKPR